MHHLIDTYLGLMLESPFLLCLLLYAFLTLMGCTDVAGPAIETVPRIRVNMAFLSNATISFFKSAG